MGAKCEAKLPVCERLGLHAHHPRNCLFYVRDKEPEILTKLLEENAIPYLKENSGVSAAESIDTESAERTCKVPIQKETSDGLKDDECGKEAPAGFATVCKAHYVEYLGLLIWQNHLDPISILSTDDLEVIIRRAYKKHPGRPYPTSDEDFRKRLLKVINEEIPL
jgi:E3 ubiquitin-protein ligase RNF31